MPRRFCSIFGGIEKGGIVVLRVVTLGETMTADRYQQQLTNLSDALEEKRSFTGQGHRKVILILDNAQPHVAKMT